MDTALTIALLLVLGVSCQWLAWRLRLPAILPLLLAGLALGPGSGLLDPDAFLGDLLFPVISLGVAIILFEGSMTLRFADARNVARIIRNLTSIGVLVSWGVMGAAAHYLVGLPWSLALLFGALVSVTGPTVVVPMLRSIQTTVRVANILRWEGILVDPLGAVLAVLLYEYMVTGHQSESLFEFGKVLVIGAALGVAGGVVLGNSLRHHLLPYYLQNFAGLALVLLVFAASNVLSGESGLVAVTVMGMIVANMKDVNKEELLAFKEHLTVILISVFFILLAARLDFDLVLAIGAPSLAVLAVALFVARPLSVLVSSIGTSVSLREKALLAWVAPRGIVAAAVSSLFALRLEEQGVERAAEIVPLTFIMIIGTVVVQSFSAGSLAKLLGLSSRDEQGVLIAGSNRVALALGEALHKAGVNVKIVDTRREGLQEARMLGIETFYGSPLSEHAENFMDITGYTHLLAMSRNSEANAVVCARYRHELGPTHVYSVQSGIDDTHARGGLALGLRPRTLFAEGVSWSKLASLLGQGAQIRATPLTDEYDFEKFRAARGGDAIHLFALDEQKRLRVFSADAEVEPASGWTVISLTVNNGR